MASRASSRTLRKNKEQKAEKTEDISHLKNTVDEVEKNIDEDSSSSSEKHEEPTQKNKISTMAFEINKAPKLEKCDREDLVKFMANYKNYLAVFEEAGADGMEPRPLKTMLKPSLLTAICKYELKKPLEEVSAAELFRALTGLMDRDRLHGPDMVKEMRKLQMRN